jgi:hypothetical protein
VPRDDRLVNVVLAECCHILPKAQAPQPDHDVHDGAPYSRFIGHTSIVHTMHASHEFGSLYNVQRGTINRQRSVDSTSAFRGLCCKSRFAPKIKNSKGRRCGFRVKM